MSIHVALHHRTTYRYDRPVALGPQIVRLRPAPHARTPILSYSLKVEPKQHFINWQQDPQGNYLARLVFPEKTELFEVVVDLVADMTVINPFDFFLEPEAENWPFAYDPSLAEEIAPFRKVEAAGTAARRPGSPRSIAASSAPSTSWSASMRGCSRRSATSSAWSRACRPARRRWRSPRARAATPAGCWSPSCAISASPRASSRAT